MNSPGDAFDAPHLAMPTDWVIDWIARDRMVRRLADAPPGVAGVVALPGPLSPGGSYRTHAERRALLPVAATEIDRSGRVEGAVLLRPGSAHREGTSSVEVEGTLLVDPGSHVHDPSISVAETVPAWPDGRSPFPVRPIVLFVCTDVASFDDRVRLLVNELLAVDVEARIAVPVVPAGAHLTLPCAPMFSSFVALAPDIVVPMDDAAMALVREWGEVSSTSVIAIEMVKDGPETQLVSWRRNSGSSPTRARVRLDVHVATFAALVNRLSSGPRPLLARAVGLT